MRPDTCNQHTYVTANCLSLSTYYTKFIYRRVQVSNVYLHYLAFVTRWCYPGMVPAKIYLQAKIFSCEFHCNIGILQPLHSQYNPPPHPHIVIGVPIQSRRTKNRTQHSCRKMFLVFSYYGAYCSKLFKCLLTFIDVKSVGLAFSSQKLQR